MSAGGLDTTTFGGALVGSNSPDGTVLGPGAIPVEATVVYPSTDAVNHDKIVVGGDVSVTTKQGTTSKFALQRYNPNGSLDASFGTQGTVLTAIGISAYVQGLAVQSDGKIIAVGEASANSTSNFVVVRYTTDGHLDSSFGTNGSGYVITQVLVPGASTSLNQSAQAVAIQGTGSSEKIYVGGWAAFTSGKGNNATKGSAFTVIRYTASGSLDIFGNGGIAVGPNFANQSNAFGLAIQPDGKILLAGNSYPSAMAVVRFTTAGVLDSSANDLISPFGTNGSGFVTLTPPNSGSSDQALASGILVQSSGAIVLSGYGYYPSAEKQVLARVSANGTLDSSTFGTSGFAVNPYILNGHNIVQTANGDLLTAGTVGSKTYDPSDDFGVAAYLPNGAPDTSFGNPLTPGTNSAAITVGEDMGRTVGLQSDGKIVVGGFSYNPTTSTYSVALARFLPPASKISSFSANPNPVAVNTSVTLSVSGILNSNPTTAITQVAFYVNSTDTMPIGYGTQTSPGVWTFSFTPTSTGSFTLFAIASDGSAFSDPVSLVLTVTTV
jgi:uncharacterized delta-60 repeat protein